MSYIYQPDRSCFRGQPSRKGIEETLLSGNKDTQDAISVTNAVMTNWNGQQVLSMRSGLGTCSAGMAS